MCFSGSGVIRIGYVELPSLIIVMKKSYKTPYLTLKNDKTYD